MQAPAPRTGAVESGLDGIGPLDWGTHLCHVYSSANDLLDTVLRFLRAGLEGGERCVWVVARPLDALKARTAMEESLPSLPRHEARLQIQVLWPWEVFSSRAAVDPEELAGAWRARADRARRDGFAGLRIAQASTAFEVMSEPARAAYELALHRSVQSQNIVALCSYPLDLCTSGTAIEGALCHHCALLKEEDRWMALESATALVGACRVRSATSSGSPVGPSKQPSGTRPVRKRRSTAVDIHDRLARLQRATAALSAVHTVDELSEVMHGVVCPDIEATAAFAAGVDLQDGSTRVVCGAPSGDGEPFFGDPGQVQEVMHLRQPIWLHDPEEVATLATERPEAQAVAALPFHIGSRQGAVVFAFPRPRTFGVASRALISDIARQVGLTVERLLLRDRLERQAERLEQESRAKDDFLAMLSHELRNPIAAIRTAAAVLRQRSAGEHRFDDVTSILERRTKQMTRLVEGLLDVSRMKRGKIELRMETVDLRRLFADAVSEHRSRITDKGIAVITALGESPVWVDADPMRITQVVDNLLSNAVRHTEAGGTISVELRTAGNEAEIVVRDTGAGIDPKILPHIFEAFQQGPHPDAPESGGLGIGLALVESIVVRHGGRVTAESAGRGRGAAFRSWLPLSSHPPSTADRRGEEERGEAPGERCRVLIVEDDHDLSTLLAEVLSAAHYEVVIAHDGRGAVESARRMRPDVLLCDIGLRGEMNGHDVAAALAAEPNPPAMVALSGATAESVEGSAFERWLTKPVDLDALEALLKTLASRSRAQCSSG